MKAFIQRIPILVVLLSIVLGLIFWFIGSEGGKCFTPQAVGASPICSPASQILPLHILAIILWAIAAVRLAVSRQ